MSSPLIVLRFSMRQRSDASLVMKLMNSLVHSCTHSLASFETLVAEGRHFFMIRLTLAMGRKRCVGVVSSGFGAGVGGREELTSCSL